jgi:Yip1 domain
MTAWPPRSRIGLREGEAFMNLVERVKAIILTPKTEWHVIDGEPGDPQYLFTNYVAILAAIPPVCRFLGMSIIGINMPMVGTFRVGIVSGLVAAIVQYLLTFVVVYVMALIIDALAPTFGGQKNPSSSLKLAVYSMTPVWLVGVFSLIPALGILGILGLYGLYLFWLGVPTLMKAPEDKSIAYTAAVVVCGIVLSLIVGAIISAIAWA